MKLYRIKAIIVRHLYEARRNFDRITDMIYWPLLDVILWGFVTIYISKTSGPAHGVVGFLLGASILWGIFYALQRDLSVGFLDELWSRNLLNLFSTPLTIWEYVTGLIAVDIFKVIVSFFAASFLAWGFYAFNIFPHALLMLPYFLNLLFFALAVGIIMTGLIFRFTTKIQTLAWSFAGLLMPVSCAFYPLSTLPPFLQSIAWYLPTAHCFEGMRQILAGGGLSASHFWWGLGLNMIYLLFAVVFFKKIFESTKARGLLVKLE